MNEQEMALTLFQSTEQLAEIESMNRLKSLESLRGPH